MGAILRKLLGHVLCNEAGEGDGGGGGAGSDEGSTETGDSPAEIREASLLGWQPKEKWQGLPEKWRPAKEFLEKGKQINAFLRRDMDTLHSKLSASEQTIQELRETIKEFAEYHRTTEERAYQKAITELKDAKKKAIEDGNGELVVEIDDKIDALKDDLGPRLVKKEVKKEGGQLAMDPVFEGWMNENPWFAKDRRLAALANAIGGEICEEMPSLKGRPFLDELTRRMKEEYPEKFENLDRRSGSPVAGGSDTRRNTSKSRTFDALPEEHKKQCLKFIQQGFIKSKEEYVRDYDWEQQ